MGLSRRCLAQGLGHVWYNPYPSSLSPSPQWVYFFKVFISSRRPSPVDFLSRNSRNVYVHCDPISSEVEYFPRGNGMFGTTDLSGSLCSIPPDQRVSIKLCSLHGKVEGMLLHPVYTCPNVQPMTLLWPGVLLLLQIWGGWIPLWDFFSSLRYSSHNIKVTLLKHTVWLYDYHH